MILAYHRPASLDEALSLLARSKPRTVPLGGGTHLSRSTPEPVEVVDLQSLSLDTIRKRGNHLQIGGTAKLQQLLENKHLPPAMRSALQLEAPLNLRNAATLAGTLVSGGGRSTVATAFLALDAKLTLQPEDIGVEIGYFLPMREEALPGKLITSITVPLNARLAFESVARTPADKPIVCAALAHWPSGRTRLALGGYGTIPTLAMDGTESDGFESAARNAFAEAADEWASAEYRADLAATLAKRCLATLNN